MAKYRCLFSGTVEKLKIVWENFLHSTYHCCVSAMDTLAKNAVIGKGNLNWVESSLWGRFGVCHGTFRFFPTRSHISNVGEEIEFLHFMLSFILPHDFNIVGFKMIFFFLKWVQNNLPLQNWWMTDYLWYLNFTTNTGITLL